MAGAESPITMNTAQRLYVKCPVCATELRSDRLVKHCRKTHNSELADDQMAKVISRGSRHPTPRQSPRARRRAQAEAMIRKWGKSSAGLTTGMYSPNLSGGKYGKGSLR